MAKAKCGCSPGTYASGWREIRSEACLEAERRAWSRLPGVAARLHESQGYQQDLRALKHAKTIDAIDSIVRAMKSLRRWNDHAAFVAEQAILRLAGPRSGPELVQRILTYQPDKQR